RGIEDEVVSVKEIFRLQGAAELKAAEKMYLPETGTNTDVIVLAASKGKKLGKLTDDKPKCMVPLNGKPILSSLIERFNEQGLKNISVVTGYKPESVKELGVATFQNDEWESTGELGSLLAASDKLKGQTIIAYGDVLVRPYVLANLLDSKAAMTVVVDSSKKNFGSRKALDLVVANKAHEPSHYDSTYTLKRVDPSVPTEEAHGEWTGLVKLSETGVKVLKDAIEALKAEAPDYLKMTIPEVLNFIVTTGRAEVSVHYTHGDWLDLDDLEDLVA
ncbi:MAG: NTP transferase domain-containing protein, partial [Myxococcales bacterium]|nr:NTP transferase domain-containing protein [Myxococcales bacterium]